MWTNRWMDKRTEKRTNERTEFHQFRKEPSYDGDVSLLSSLNLIGQTVLELESGNANVGRRIDRQTDKKRTNEQTEFHQYRKEPSYDADLCPCQV